MNDCSISTSFDIHYEYRTYFVHGIFQEQATLLNEILKPFRKVLFLVEDAVAQALPELIRTIEAIVVNNNLPCIGIQSIDGGEQLKDNSGLMNVCKVLDDTEPCRQSAVIIVGGGAFLDAVGMAVAIFHRGVNQIRIPTTALAQCDSGVGVKNAINAFGKKNLLGTFAPPYAVINDADFLKSLPLRERRNAVAEMIKVAMIKDADSFCWLEEHAQQLGEGLLPPLETAIQRSAQLHLDHIGRSGDPFERFNARPLDFGHWAAHKLEMLSNGRLRHGEAVATGLLIDTLYAERTGLLTQPLFTRLESLIKRCMIHLGIRELLLTDINGVPAVMQGLKEFQEHLGGNLILTFPTKLGEKIDTEDIDLEALQQAVLDVAHRFPQTEP